MKLNTDGGSSNLVLIVSWRFLHNSAFLRTAHFENGNLQFLPKPKFYTLQAKMSKRKKIEGRT